MNTAFTYQMALTLIRGVGPNLAKVLTAYTGSVENVFKEKQLALAKIPGIGAVLSAEIVNGRDEALKRAEEEFEFIEKKGISVYHIMDDAYPYRLKECPDAPLMLFGKGSLQLNEGKFIGVVGTRKATESGKENTRKLIHSLAAVLPDLTIVSGLAYGIDICAHKAALEAGVATIGVLGHGLDRIYPASHRSDAIKMCEKGGLLTEFISGTNPDRPNFVQRNRIIAGMCDALIVAESHAKGGSLITANLANDYDRDVFAFPGRVEDESSQGCNALIKTNKAALIESGEDVLRFMGWDNNKKQTNRTLQTSLFVDLSEEEKNILALLQQYPDGVQMNELTVLLSCPFSKVSSLLLGLEFKNMVKCLPGNLYILIK